MLRWVKLGQKPNESSGPYPLDAIFSLRLSASCPPVCLITSMARGQRSFSTVTSPPAEPGSEASPTPGAMTGGGHRPSSSIVLPYVSRAAAYAGRSRYTIQKSSHSVEPAPCSPPVLVRDCHGKTP